jgi:3-isopropylmalate/(R)-2-methylmalate dehydratase large subunit
VTSPQAFEGLRLANRKPWRSSANIATPDHNVPTTDREKGLEGITDSIAKLQVITLDDNCKEHGITQFDILDKRQGIVHVVGPEQGLTLPGMTLVCGDSHTSTHGALATLAMGIGTSEVEHVLASQCLSTTKLKNMKVCISGELEKGVTAKDVTLAVIAKIGTDGGTGHAIEYCGKVIEEMSIEGRMTVCNMSIEAGARAGMVAPDQVTFDYLKDKPMSPKGGDWDLAVEWWESLPSDEGAFYDKKITIDATKIKPTVTWGTSPEDVVSIDGFIPDPNKIKDDDARVKVERSLEYMGLKGGQKISEVEINTVFIGSCTNSRIEDLRSAARIIEGKKVKQGIRAMVVPGSGLVKAQAEEEGLNLMFIEAGFEWREPGCSMCLAINEDKLQPGERCASTSNRNFEGRQGKGGRTHLVSPEIAAASAITGRLTDCDSIS